MLSLNFFLWIFEIFQNVDLFRLIKIHVLATAKIKLNSIQNNRFNKSSEMIKITTFGNILLILIDLFGIFDNFSKKN